MHQLKIYSPHLEINQSTLSSIEKAFFQATDRFAKSVRQAEVRLKDLNGPRGGEDKICTLEIRLYPRGYLLVKSKGASILEVVRSALDKAKLALTKRHERNLKRV